MSQGYHHGNNIYSFPNGFERSEHQQIILREKLGGGISASDENSDAGIPNVYDTAGMLSEMFSYPATQLLHQMGPPGYQQNPRQPQPQPPVTIQEWYSDRKDPNVLEFRDVSSSVHSVHVDQHQQRQHNQQQQLHHMSDISVADSAASAMQLFLMNPQSRTPSSSPGQVSSTSHINTLQMLLPNNTNTSPFNSWGGGGGGGGKVQGLSLSLASSLEAAKAEQLFFTQHHQQFQQQQQGTLHFNHQMNINNGIFVGPSSTLSSMNILRNSKYAKPTQELLEEFCSVGRGHFKKNKFKNNLNPSNTDKDQTEATTSGAGGGASLSSATKEGSTAPPPPTLSAAERAEHQRKKVKLLAMLDEVDRRYSHYCEQMQLVVNSFDLVMGFGSAMPYTALAQKAMSRHFRCLKDTIAAQLKRSCELLGEKDAAASGGVTKGETPRLRIIEQSLRQQRAFHQMGMMETEAWRPQRGLPERSVNILRAWLFENFLHPYPSDADKHLLARQTGLSRSQVSNWFINARVRLWKPMVEEMYQQEAKEEDQASDQNLDNNATSNNNDNMNDDQNDLLDSSSQQQDHTRASSSSHHFSTPHQAQNMIIMSSSATQPQDYYNRFHVEMMAVDDDHRRHRESGSSAAGTVLSTTTSVGYIGGGPGLIRFGTTTAAGDVSLTLGLRQHSGNLPEKNSFSVREFGGC